MQSVTGIDLGLKGAIATVSLYPLTLVKVTDMPVVDNSICAYQLKSIIKQHKSDHIVIENVHAMPNQGVVSMFKFGRSKGLVEGVLAAQNKQIEWVTAKKWKSYYQLSKQKDESRNLATALFRTSTQWPLKKHDGRAEATLIALYGLIRRQHDQFPQDTAWMEAK